MSKIKSKHTRPMRLEAFATRHPILFGLAVNLACIAMLLVVAKAVPLLSSEVHAQVICSDIGRLLVAFLFILLLLHLRWFRAAGFRRTDGPGKWLAIIPPTIYLCIVVPYIMFYTLRADLSYPLLSALIFLHGLTAGLIEETVFRGVIMYGLLRSWGDTHRGVTKAVWVSTLFFGMTHISNMLVGGPLFGTLSQAIYAVAVGICLAAIVLYTKSIWPGMLFHGLIDATTQVIQIGKTGGLPPASSILLIVAMLPVGLYGLYLLRRARVARQQAGEAKE